jgi:hypothetical protein
MVAGMPLRCSRCAKTFAALALGSALFVFLLCYLHANKITEEGTGTHKIPSKKTCSLMFSTLSAFKSGYTGEQKKKKD